MQAPTASLSSWMVVDYHGQPCLFGFALKHPATGGLSWTISTPVREIGIDRAQTQSGRVYQLGTQIGENDLDVEGRTVLRLLTDTSNYAGRDQDIAWVTTQKMARHLNLTPPANDAALIEAFLADHEDRYRKIIVR